MPDVDAEPPIGGLAIPLLALAQADAHIIGAVVAMLLEAGIVPERTVRRTLLAPLRRSVALLRPRGEIADAETADVLHAKVETLSGLLFGARR
jgi:hypothetical protein